MDGEKIFGWCSFLFLGWLSTIAEAGNVLIIPPFTSPSHKLALIALADGLAERGHNVLIYEPSSKLNKYYPKVAKMDQFLIESGSDFLQKLLAQNDSMAAAFIWGPPINKPFEEPFAAVIGSVFAENYLQTHAKDFYELLKTPWDLLIVDELFNPFGYLAADLLRQKFDTALGLYVSNMRMTVTASAFNTIPLPLGYWPSFGNVNGFTDHMSFVQRSQSVALTGFRFLSEAVKEFLVHFRLGRLIHEFTGVTPALNKPDFVLCAFPQEFELTFPTRNNVVYIGGIHAQSKKPEVAATNATAPARHASEIPEDMLELIDKHSAGFILIALGHMANWHLAPDRYKDAFVGAFNRLPKDLLVIFSCSGGFPEHRLPPNVRIYKWLPQRALFQHPKIRMFFSHGGGNSVVEASINGIPMVVMGLFAEQSDGAVRVQEHGLGIRICKGDLTAETMFSAMNEILTNPKYRENAKRFANRMKGAPERAMQRGIFWSEFVMRQRQSLKKRLLFRKAIHTDSAVADLDYVRLVQYLSLDVISLGVVILGVVLYVTLLAFKRLYMWIQNFR